MVQKYKKLSIVAKASFFAGLVQRGISILTIPIFTRILSTDEFAQYTLYQSWHDILVIFISLYVFNYAVYSGLKEFEDDSNGFIATTQTLITGLCLLCFSIYYIIHIFIGDIIGFPIHIIILMFFDMLFFSAFNVWAAKERYEFRYKLMTILSILIGILGPIIGLIFIRYFPNKGYGRIYGVAIANIFFGFFIYIYGFIKSKNKFDKKYIKFLLAYCLPLIPHFLASNVLTRFDRIIIGEMCSIAEAGIYGLAYSLSCFTQLVNDSILKSLTPLTYKLIKDNKNTNLLKKTTNYLVLRSIIKLFISSLLLLQVFILCFYITYLLI